MKKAMKVILIIILIIAVLTVLLWFGLKKIWHNIMTAQMAPDNYTTEVKTGGDIEAKYLTMGSYKVKYFTFDYTDNEDIKTVSIWYPAELETSDRK